MGSQASGGREEQLVRHRLPDGVGTNGLFMLDLFKSLFRPMCKPPVFGTPLVVVGGIRLEASSHRD